MTGRVSALQKDASNLKLLIRSTVSQHFPPQGWGERSWKDDGTVERKCSGVEWWHGGLTFGSGGKQDGNGWVVLEAGTCASVQCCKGFRAGLLQTSVWILKTKILTENTLFQNKCPKEILHGGCKDEYFLSLRTGRLVSIHKVTSGETHEMRLNQLKATRRGCGHLKSFSNLLCLLHCCCLPACWVLSSECCAG